MRSASLACPPPPAVPVSGCGMIGLDVFICCLFKVRFLAGAGAGRAGLKASLWTSCRGCLACSTHTQLSEKAAQLQLSLGHGRAWAVCPHSSLPCLAQQTLPEPCKAGCWLTSVQLGIQPPEPLWRKILPPGRRERKVLCSGGACLMLICWEALGPSFTF